MHSQSFDEDGFEAMSHRVGLGPVGVAIVVAGLQAHVESAHPEYAATLAEAMGLPNVAALADTAEAAAGELVAVMRMNGGGVGE